MNPRIKLSIALLMAATVFRAQTVFFLPTIESFGGISPDAWFGPWLADAVLGLLVPVMLYLFWFRRGLQLWGVLVAYNAIGVFDYSQGLITQLFHPMPAELASPMLVYGGIGVCMLAQFIALGLLTRREVARYFADVSSWARTNAA
ncbi:MAG: hypothetical protein AAGE01_22265 [Pseudomonadota bacterium]